MGGSSLEAARRITRERAEGTEVVPPTETFEDAYVLEMGDTRIEARYLGPAHSPGDIVIWLPEQSLVISGDMAFHERMLPIFAHTNTRDWLETWDTEFEALGATYVIPGHGHPTNMAQVRRYTKDYLEYLRARIAEHLDAGGTSPRRITWTSRPTPSRHVRGVGHQERGPRLRADGMGVTGGPRMGIFPAKKKPRPLTRPGFLLKNPVRQPRPHGAGRAMSSCVAIAPAHIDVTATQAVRAKIAPPDMPAPTAQPPASIDPNPISAAPTR